MVVEGLIGLIRLEVIYRCKLRVTRRKCYVKGLTGMNLLVSDDQRKGHQKIEEEFTPFVS